jgi:hypothetical protein
MHACGMRADDAQIIHLTDMCSPDELPNVGPAKCLLWTILLKGGKTAGEGKVQHAGLVRHTYVHCCPIGALARYFIKRFTLDKEPFPDPRDWQNDW